jgi:D-alanyl-D-alanine carboxypeptidase
VKAWIVGVAILIVVVVSGVGLWMTWDSTQTPASEPLGEPVGLSSSNEVPALTGTEGSNGTDEATDGPAASPECTPAETAVAQDPLDGWQTVVADPGHRLPADFVPPDLVDLSAAGFESTGDTIRQIVVPDLAALRAAADANGTPFIIVSAYRSYEHQQRLFDQQVQELGPAQAATTTARPGHSEHQLGTTIDVLDPEAAELTTAFATTPAGRWLAAHAHEYGFVMSYPNEARELTCYDFEPWHLRYVGRDVAQRIRESGLTPREWMLSQPRTVR